MQRRGVTVGILVILPAIDVVDIFRIAILE